jgi:hypothetical protein
VGTDVLRLLRDDQIADTSDLTVRNSGLFDLNDNTDRIGSLTMQGGTVDSGTGALILGGNITTFDDDNTAFINGNLSLGGASRTFDVNSGEAAAFGGAYQRLTADAAPTERGWGNTAFGAKWRFYENETSKLSVALKPEIQFPVSKSRESRGLGAARASYALGLLLTQETGFGAVHANLAAEKIDYADAALDAAERRTRYRASVAPVWDVTEQWKLALDAGIVTNPDRTAKRYFGYLEVGAIYSPSKDLDFALGIVRNVRDGEARTTLATLGVTWRFR